MKIRFRKIIDNIRIICDSINEINGLILYGSQVSGKLALFSSDIDMIIVMKNYIDEDFFLKKLKIGLSIIDEKICFSLNKPNKLVIFLEDNLLKIELNLIKITELDTLSKYFYNFEIYSILDMVLIDRKGKISKILHKIISEKPIFSKAEFIETTIADFIYYYELASNRLNRGDIYGFYFQYNLALHKLVQLIYLQMEEIDSFHLPRQIVGKLANQEEIDELMALSGSFSAFDAYLIKDKLFDSFQKYFISLNKIYQIKYTEEDIKFYRSKIDERYWLWNLRDIGYYYTSDRKQIKKGKILRSSKLIFTYSEDKVISFIDSYEIKTIIDIRTKKEIKKRSYSDFIKTKVKYVPLSFLDKDEVTTNLPKYDKFSPREGAYIHMAIDYNEELRQIFEILSNRENYNILIHCIAGKDRTGFIMMLIELVLGLTKRDIIFDYLSSENDVTLNLIQILLDYIEERGGIYEYLKEIGIEDKWLLNLKKIMIQETI